MMALKSSLVPYRPFSAMDKNAGFTLIEVLIAMVVLAVGLLGLAGLQVTSLRSNQSAYNRTQATQLAYDLADRMRANVAGKITYTTILPSAATVKANCLTTAGCSPSEMAENDLYEWNCAVAGGCENNTPPIAATLPGGQGIVCLDSTPNDGTSAAVANCDGAGNTYAIKIWWDDDRSGAASLRFVTSFRL